MGRIDRSEKPLASLRNHHYAPPDLRRVQNGNAADIVGFPTEIRMGSMEMVFIRWSLVGLLRREYLQGGRMDIVEVPRYFPNAEAALVKYAQTSA